MYTGVFAVLLAASRREWLATAVVVVFSFLLSIAGTGFPPLHQAVLVRAGAGPVPVPAARRPGRGRLPVHRFAIGIAPLTLDPSAWYFGASLTYLRRSIGLAGYGAVVAVGGRSFFKGVLGDD